METTKHGMTKYTKNEDYLHTDHFNAIVENVEKLYTEAEQESEKRVQKEEELADALAEHAEDQNNPHGVTATQIGLGNVNNTADINKPVSILQAEAIGQVNQSLESHKAESGIHHTHANKAVLDQIKQEHLESSITILASAFTVNTDEYAAYYPYYTDHAITGMTESCWADVNYTPATLALECMSPQARTMTGKIRLYADSLPSASITIDTILWKEMN